MAAADAYAFGEVIYGGVAFVEYALVTDQPRCPFDDCDAAFPCGTKWRGLRPTPETRPITCQFGGCCTCQEFDIATVGQSDRADAAAIDARRPDADEEPAIELWVTREPCLLAFGDIKRHVRTLQHGKGPQKDGVRIRRVLGQHQPIPVVGSTQDTAMERTNAMGILDWALLLLLSILWGGSFFFSKIALSELPPLLIVLARVAIAAAALLVYLRVMRQAIPVTADVWAAFFGMGILNNLIPFSLLFWGQTQIASGLASILNATTPIFSIIVAHVLTKDERMTSNKLLGIVLGVAGVAILMAGNVVSSQAVPYLALFACLTAALSYGFAGVFGRCFRRMGIAPATSAFGQTAATTLVMLPIVFVIDPPWRQGLPGLTTIGALVGLGLLSTALAYIIFFHILAVGGAINSSLVTLLIPVSAILLGSAFLGERLTVNQFAGMALIALGLLSIDGRPLKWLRRKGEADGARS